jgi:pimeloyl-ACP methyl ester carboxylesterase
VLVHAIGFHGHVWKRIAQALSRDYQVVALDRRGRGASPKPVTRALHKFLDA